MRYSQFFSWIRKKISLLNFDKNQQKNLSKISSEVKDIKDKKVFFMKGLSSSPGTPKMKTKKNLTAQFC